VIPAVLVLILILLGLLLRSLVAPWYLAATVGLSYLASLGFAMIVFVHLGTSGGLIFVLPLLMFVFSMALGEDYNILVMAPHPRGSPPGAHPVGRADQGDRHHRPALSPPPGSSWPGRSRCSAWPAATPRPSSSASLSPSACCSTPSRPHLLVPAIARLAGRWNWWPSALSRQAAGSAPAGSGQQASRSAGSARRPRQRGRPVTSAGGSCRSRVDPFPAEPSAGACPAVRP